MMATQVEKGDFVGPEYLGKPVNSQNFSNTSKNQNGKSNWLANIYKVKKRTISGDGYNDGQPIDTVRQQETTASGSSESASRISATTDKKSTRKRKNTNPVCRRDWADSDTEDVVCPPLQMLIELEKLNGHQSPLEDEMNSTSTIDPNDDMPLFEQGSAERSRSASSDSDMPAPILEKEVYDDELREEGLEYEEKSQGLEEGLEESMDAPDQLEELEKEKSPDNEGYSSEDEEFVIDEPESSYSHPTRVYRTRSTTSVDRSKPNSKSCVEDDQIRAALMENAVLVAQGGFEDYQLPDYLMKEKKKMDASSKKSERSASSRKEPSSRN